MLQLGTWHSDGNVDSATTATDAVRDHAMVAVDPSALKSESNLFRYRSVAQIVIRVTTPTDDIDLARAVADAVCGELGGPRPVVSVPPELADRWPGTVPEDDHAFVDRVGATPFARIRYLGSPSGELWRAARSSHAQIIDDPVVSNGRLELRHYVREQSVTRTLHRHGMILDESAAG